MPKKYIWPYPDWDWKICCLFYIKVEVCFSYLNIYRMLRQNKLKLTRIVSLFFKATTSIKYYDYKNLSKYCITCFSFLRSIIPFAKYFFLICIAQGCANIFCFRHRNSVMPKCFMIRRSNWRLIWVAKFFAWWKYLLNVIWRSSLTWQRTY